MCMRNVNATMLMCSSVGLNNPSNISFSGVFDSIIPIKEEEVFYLENLNIVLSSTIIFDERFEGQSDYFKLNQLYEFMIRLTHVPSGDGIALCTFELAVDKKQLKTWCKNFYEFNRVIKIHQLPLPKGLGDYALKLLIRPKSDNQEAAWNTQTLHKLLVGESR